MAGLMANARAADCEGGRAAHPASRRALIALDFDGTLAPIVADPREARADPGAWRGCGGLPGWWGRWR